MIEKETFIVLNIIKKEDFTGSLKGMRYRLSLKKGEIPKDTCMEVTIWPQPYNFEKTEDDKKEKKEFPFSEEGRVQVVEWLNEQYLLQKSRWDEALVWKC